MALQIEVKKQERSRPRWIQPQGRYARGYLSPSYREFNSKPRVYVHPKDEGVLANFANRFDRPIKLYREAAKQALAQLGIEGKIGWSQKAGCSCGCSPGFVLSPESDGGAMPYDVWVTIIDAPEQELTARGADRLDQLLSDPTIAGALGVKTSRRNYGSMKPAKLLRSAKELRERKGEAFERTTDPEGDLVKVEALIEKRGL